MHQPGLYFPFVHVRDDDWLKVAALYWPSVRRLVPRGYVKHDSRAARTFVEADILRDEEPRQLLSPVVWGLLDTLHGNAHLLARDYSLARARADWDGQYWAEGSGPDQDNPALGWIHVTKFPTDIVEYLSGWGLAQRGRPLDVISRHSGRPEDWIGLHPALAGAYMTVLATRVSEASYFQPLTDQADLRVATPSSDVQTAIQLLLGRAGDELSDRADAGVETYVMLALRCVRPKNLEGVPAERIVKCRESLAEELAAFRDHVASQRTELAALAAIPNERRRLESFADHVQQTIEVPLQKLERGLLLHNLEPTRSFILASSFAPPLMVNTALGAVGAASPVAGTATGAVVAMGSAWWQVRNIRARAKASSPVGYLLDIRDQLTPRTLAAHARKVLRGTYGRR